MMALKDRAFILGVYSGTWLETKVLSVFVIHAFDPFVISTDFKAT